MRRIYLKTKLKDLVDRTGRVEDMLEVLAGIYRERARHPDYAELRDDMLATAHVLHEASEAVAAIFGEEDEEALEHGAERAAWQARHEAGRGNPRRAKAGGEVGMNAEFYPGGTFLPSTRLPKGERPRYSSGSGRMLVAPGQLEVAPEPGLVAIFESIRSIIRQRPDGTVEPFPPSHPYWEYSGDDHARVADLCDRWNAGERWMPRRR